MFVLYRIFPSGNLERVFYLNLDISDLLRLDQNLVPAMERAARAAAEQLSAQTHAHIVERVQAKLRSTREKYLENLGMQQVDGNTWVIQVDQPALFIEDGLPPNFDMIDSLLDDSPRPGAKNKPTGKTKTAKDGSRYRVVPFEHSKAKTRQTPAQTSLTDTIKSEMKRRGMPGIGTLEVDGNGKPKQGLVRSFSIRNQPVKTSVGPGQGKGPMGAVRQGPTGIPFLQGVRIYQKTMKDGKGKDVTKKAVMTFRVVSTKHKGQGRWIHPGLQARKFLDEAVDWALREWETKIKDSVLDQVLNSL